MNNTPKIWPWIVAVVVILAIGWAIIWSINQSNGTTAPVSNTPTENNQTVPVQVENYTPTVTPTTDNSNLSTSSATTTR